MSSKHLLDMKRLLFFAITVFLLGFASCQDEEDVQSVDNSQSLTKDAPLSILMRRVTQNPTNFDNILDGTASFSVVLPVSITINGQYIHVVDNNDLAFVKSIKNTSTTDDDVVHFGFPITLKRPDYSETIIQNQTQYDAFLSSCGSDSNFHEISCVGFKFPVQVKLYNTSTQSASFKKLYTKAEMYSYILSVNADEIYSITYPAEMQKPDGTWFAVNNNADLQSFIESNINTCESVSNQNTFSEVVSQGTWYVSNFMDEGHDETYEFNGYTFVFNANGTTVATKNSMNTYGTWETFPHDGHTKFEINYTNPNGTLHYLEEDWIVVEYSSTTIKLSHQSGGGGEYHLITLTKI